jgi:LysM repeat protein
MITIEVGVPDFQWVPTQVMKMKSKDTLERIVAAQTVGQSDIQDPLS